MNDSENELTPEEAAAFVALPRHGVAIDELAEERTVRALRTRGLLVEPHNRQRARLVMFGAGAAAALLIFAAGAFFGRQMASRDVRTASPSIDVQQAGTAYVAALVRLSGAKDSERTPGLAVGTATLRAAASSLAQLAPDDSLAQRIRTSLDGSGEPLQTPSGRSSVIWF